MRAAKELQWILKGKRVGGLCLGWILTRLRAARKTSQPYRTIQTKTLGQAKALKGQTGSKVMSPKHSALEEMIETQEAADLLNINEEGEMKTEFNIGTEPEVESEKGSVEGEVFKTPQQ